MARHARKSTAPIKRALAAIVALAISAFGLVAAQATTPTLDINKGTLSFTSAKEKRGTNPLSNALNQSTADSSATDDIGEGIFPGDYVDYYGIATVGSDTVDARVTLVSENASMDADEVDGALDKLDDRTGTTANNTRIKVQADFNNTNGGEDYFVELRIDFYEDLATTPTEVELENVFLSIYDIDGLQFVEISDFDQYYLSSTGSILTADASTGILRLQADATETSSNDDSDVTIGRASFDFLATSSITLKLGTDSSAAPGNAFFDLDFGPGVSWTGNAQGPAVANPVAANKLVSFIANGGSGVMPSQAASTTTALRSNALNRSGFTFAGWNTEANGTGTAYADGANFPFTTNTILYAQWTAVTQPDNAEQEEETPPPAPVPYSGPVPVSLDISCLAASTTGTAKLTGERLNTITSATVDGKAITLTAVTSSSITLALPELAAGTYDITYVSSLGSITHQDSLRVCATSTPAPTETVVTEGETKPFYVAKRFSNYRGDRGPVVARDRAAITAFIKANPGLTHVTCVGSTSGIPALETDPALAMARAKNACSVVESLVPGVKTRLVTSTGRGVGQFFRAVTLFGKGIQPN